MPSKIVLSKKEVTIIHRCAINDFPEECCGFLFGSIETGNRIIFAMPVLNSWKGNRRRRYEIAPIAYIRAEQYALDNYMKLTGIYHSHPNHPAVPSEYDLENALPFFSYLIISVKGKIIMGMKSWTLSESLKHFDEEKVIIS